ncbi:hypothetical protein OPU71_10195 [Niveibacterium sp. 24ML]|uniref:hypothetical protein n=1 Tax=Niveibacterium sp. 24ML TaxID=2985512 RepID=UPI00226D7545|nr:hypothetical protein [Niveibacterium sp. 24ML]MCX9156491.1 hypothetical protein [Niveibacterium sp. 24ML]
MLIPPFIPQSPKISIAAILLVVSAVVGSTYYAYVGSWNIQEKLTLVGDDQTFPAVIRLLDDKGNGVLEAKTQEGMKKINVTVSSFENGKYKVSAPGILFELTGDPTQSHALVCNLCKERQDVQLPLLWHKTLEK